MARNNIRRNFICGTFLVGAAFLLAVSASPRWPGPAEDKPAGGMVLSVNPAASQVHWELHGSVHNVHGTFKVTSGKVEFDPSSGKASGAIVVDARSGESENESRDKKMHKDVLESEKFSQIVFHPIQVEGKVAASGSSKIQIHGIFDIHGVKKEIVLPMQVELAGDHWKGTGEFKIPYADWGMKNPSNFFLKVDSEVSITLDASGGLQGAGNAKH